MTPFIKLLLSTGLFLAGLDFAYAACEPEISYPIPIYGKDTLREPLGEITKNLDGLINAGEFAKTSFSLEISSSRKTLYTKYHTDKSLGGRPIDGSSVYRIASGTKMFTALGILKQEALGNLNLDDGVTKYVSSLANGSSKVSWKGITIRSLLAHAGGLPDNFDDEDLLLTLTDPSVIGLPPVTAAQLKNLPECGLYSNWTNPCTAADLNYDLHQVDPVFTPQKETSYSNVGYDILGEILSNVTGAKYEDYISTSILKPLGMKDTTFNVPGDSVTAKAGSGSYWGYDLGVGIPSGGMYSTSSDMMKFFRWTLKNHDKITPTINWFQPSAWNSGSHSLLGYPWEIFRSTEILPNTKRPVTFYTKGGGLEGYYSYSIIIPQYDLVIFMSVAGELAGLSNLYTKVLNPLVITAESEAQSQLNNNYGGVYVSTDRRLNSSITFSHTDARALHITSWVSNSTEVLAALGSFVSKKAGTTGDLYFQLMPTFRTKRSSDGRIGDIWRFINVIDDYDHPTNATTVWNDYCVVNIDPLSYGKIPVNELVFWRAANGSNSVVDEVTLSAFRVTLRRS